MNFMRRALPTALTVALAATALAGCASGAAEEGGSTSEGGAEAKGLTVYATTGYLADAVMNIAPDAEVITMVGPGGDPHTFVPETKDIEAIQSADVVFWNGLHLEAQMLDLLAEQGDRQLAVGDQLPHDMLLDWPETDAEGHALHDPHIWNSPAAWQLVVTSIGDKLAAIDADNADTYVANAKAYNEKIDAADKKAAEQLKAVKAPRILITGHDAFNYFGKTYDLEVMATDFVSTEAALSAEELAELADLIADKKIPVIFQDNQANPQAITSLKEAVQARGWDVEVSGTELFADSLGAEAPVDTYLGVFAHNATAVSEELGK